MDTDLLSWDDIILVPGDTAFEMENVLVGGVVPGSIVHAISPFYVDGIMYTPHAADHGPLVRRYMIDLLDDWLYSDIGWQCEGAHACFFNETTDMEIWMTQGVVAYKDSPS